MSYEAALCGRGGCLRYLRMRSSNLRPTSEIRAALIDYALLVGCSAFLVIASSAITSKA
ncbi:MAG: hypothetical protein RL417_645 [Pseudomonadota bacterium]|jgi:hypothetical protein